MGLLVLGLFITILFLFHQISSSIQQSVQVDPSTTPNDRDEILSGDRRTLKNQTESKLVEARAKICGLETEIQCEQKEISDEFIKINSKISQSDDRSTKIGADLKEIDSKVAKMSTKMAKLEADLVDERERNRELERKIAETKRKNEDLEAQLRTEVRDGKGKLGELDGKINALQNKNSGLETQINQTMTFLDLDEWSYLAKTASWYKVIDQGMTFDVAVAYCASRKSHLVSIHSQEEHDFVCKLGSNSHFWIGLKRNPNKGNVLEWADGISVDFTNWGSGQPDSDAHAALYTGDGKWRVYGPTYHYRFICKRSSQF